MTSECELLPRQRRRISAATALLIVAAAFVVLVALGFCVGLYLSNKQIKDELARIRAAGEPVTAADLEAFYSLPPDSRDSTSLWVHAAEVVASATYQADLENFGIGDYDKVLPKPGDVWPQQATAERLLPEYADVLATLHEAAAMGGTARYPTRYTENTALLFGPQKELRHVAFLLALEAEVNARRGDAHAAALSVHSLFALARSLEREPLNVWQLTRLGNDRVAVDQFERAIATVDFSDDDLAAIDDDLAAIDYLAGFYRGMLGDRVFGMQMFGYPDVVGGQTPGPVKWTILRQGDFALYLQLMRDLVAAGKAADALALRAAINDADERARVATSAAGAAWRYPITRQLTPSLQASVNAICRATARKDAARTAIAVERFRRVRGRWPQSLDNLVPEFMAKLPADPYSDGPIKSRVDGAECRIYSVGPDGVDQGGDDDESGGVQDIVFHLPLRRPVKPPVQSE